MIHDQFAETQLLSIHPCALREVALGHVLGGGDLGLDAGDGLARGAQLAVPLGNVGGEEAAILRL